MFFVEILFGRNVFVIRNFVRRTLKEIENSEKPAVLIRLWHYNYMYNNRLLKCSENWF